MASSAEESWQTDAATGDEESRPSKMASPEVVAAPVDDPAVKAAATMPFKVSLGLRLEAKDYNGLWYPAKVMDIDDEKQVGQGFVARCRYCVVRGERPTSRLRLF